MIEEESAGVLTLLSWMKQLFPGLFRIKVAVGALSMFFLAVALPVLLMRAAGQMGMAGLVLLPVLGFLLGCAGLIYWTGLC